MPKRDLFQDDNLDNAQAELSAVERRHYNNIIDQR